MLRSIVLALAAGLATGGTMAPIADAPRWDRDNILAFRALLDEVAAEGLAPADYDAAALHDAIARDEPELAGLADAAALRLAHDMFEGRRDLAARPGWHFDRPSVQYRAWLDEALAAHSLAPSFRRLLPEAPGYAGLRSALAICVAARRDCDDIRINLDRWRALPRGFGPRYLWVNVPAFRLDLVERGRVVASHRVIVGKAGTKTPLFEAMVTGVTANPWWNVPCSIVDESIGKLLRTDPGEAARRGFVASRDAQGRLVVRQRPGPANALGRIKFEMPNPHGVYLHDTPSRTLFAKDVRALSHGCIRTEAPDILAKALLGPEGAMALDTALVTASTRTVKLVKPLPVYIVYLTAEADRSAAGGIVRYPDVYRRDAAEGGAWEPAPPGASPPPKPPIPSAPPSPGPAIGRAPRAASPD